MNKISLKNKNRAIESKRSKWKLTAVSVVA